MLLRRTLTAVGLLALLIGPMALAQRAAQTQASQAGTIMTPVNELRQRALRLTVLNSLPEEARAEATALMDRAQALKAEEQELMVAKLEAYVAALEAGDSPQVAQDLATGEVAEQSADVTRKREALRKDVEAFVQAHPDLRGRLMQAGQFGRGESAMFGMGELERGMGPMFGADRFGPGAGPMPGADELGMHRRGLPRGAQRMHQSPECEWLKEFNPPGRDLQTP